MPDTETLPLFPLHAVLLPGAPLGLRVFERRYLDLVAECGRSGRSFGVCMILEGEESGAPATPAAFGVEALVEDFDTGAGGVLTLKVRGARRFRLASTTARDSGLLVGQVQWREGAGDAEAGQGPRLLPEHAVLGTLLGELLQKVGDIHGGANLRLLEDAAWVGWRLAEILPLSDGQRLALLQQDDPHRRLQQLLLWMDE